MSTPWIDGHGRTISYLRLSLTDRCDLRCVYCMAEDMQFIPRHQTLSLGEIYRLCQIFVSQGTRKIRFTGGEPLIYPSLLELCKKVSALPGLSELVLTTNGARLAALAKPLQQAGVKRLNISLDTLKPERFRKMTRIGKLDHTLAGIKAAQAAGFTQIKLNSVILHGQNDDEIIDLVSFATEQQVDITFIEEMPLGDVGRDRSLNLFTSDQVHDLIKQHWSIAPCTANSGGPARYFELPDHPATRVGFISPHSHNFCTTCNRVRLTAEGQLLLCLGHENAIDLRHLLRTHPTDNQPIIDAIQHGLLNKPLKHDFKTDGDIAVIRFMNASGG